MILTSFSYKSESWSLPSLAPLQQTNLLVGMNATGKTKTIMALHNVAAFMQSQALLFGDRSFSTSMEFTESEGVFSKMHYSFEVFRNVIVSEHFSVDGVQVIKRRGSSAFYRKDKIDPPLGRLVVQIRRDRTAYPEIEKLMSWIEGVMSLSCSDINHVTILNFQNDFIKPISFNELVNSLTAEEKKRVFKNAKELGYDIVDMIPIDVSGSKIVSVKERGARREFWDVNLSSGMLRVLYLLCYMEYLKHDNKTSLLLIDDIGEGLDYNRSTKLGKMIFEACEKDGMQLIASSNDSFLMDVVDISKWQVLRRRGSEVRSLNESNSENLFRQFRLTGLSNFDLFSSDFIDSHIR